MQLLPIAMQEYNVSFIPGVAFLSKKDKHVQNLMRLSFSYNNPDAIMRGMSRLGAAILACASK